MDENDEPNTEDLSSDVFDGSRLTDGDPGPASAGTINSPGGADDIWSTEVIAEGPTTKVVPSQPAATSTPAKDTQSRFKIVKIESKEHRKGGRWVCFDFADPVGSVVAAVPHSEKKVKNGLPTEEHKLSIVPSESIYYFPNLDVQHGAKSPFAPAIFYAAGQRHPVLERNPLESPMFLNRTQSFFRGNEWDSVEGPVGAPTTITLDTGARLPGNSVASGNRYLTARQLESLSPKAADFSVGGSGADLLSMITKGAGPGSPLYDAMVSATMNPISDNEKRFVFSFTFF